MGSYKPTRLPGVYTYELERRCQGRPDVCFVVSYKLPDGKKRWEKVGLRSEGYDLAQAAEVRAARLRALRHDGEVKTAREIARERQAEADAAALAQRLHDRILAEVVDSYFTDGRGAQARGRVTDLGRWEKWIKPAFGERRVSELAAADVDRLQQAMLAAGRAPQTVKNTLELLRRVCRHGVRHGLCPALGFTIELPACDNETTEHLTPEELARLVKVLDEWPSPDVARLVRVALLTGMRRGELFKLEDRDLDWTHNLLTLRSPKGKRTMAIPLSGPVAAILREQVAWRDRKEPRGPFVFPGRGGAQRVECTAVDRIKAAAQLPDSFRPFHGLRHHYAVALANSGEADLGLISELLTHKDPNVTRRYAKFLPHTLHAAAERAATLILGSAPSDPPAPDEPDRAEIEAPDEEPDNEGGRVLQFRAR